MSNLIRRRGSALRWLVGVLAAIFFVPGALLVTAALAYKQTHAQHARALREEEVATAAAKRARATVETRSTKSQPAQMIPVGEDAGSFRPVTRTVIEQQRRQVIVPTFDAKSGKTINTTREQVVAVPVTVTEYRRVVSPSHSQEVMRAINEIREMNEDDESRDAKVEKVKRLLAEEFEANHKRQAEEIERTSKRLDALRTMHEQRAANREEIVQRRLDQLTGQPDALQWTPSTAQGDTSGGQPGAPSILRLQDPGNRTRLQYPQCQMLPSRIYGGGVSPKSGDEMLPPGVYVDPSIPPAADNAVTRPVPQSFAPQNRPQTPHFQHGDARPESRRNFDESAAGSPGPGVIARDPRIANNSRPSVQSREETVPRSTKSQDASNGFRRYYYGFADSQQPKPAAAPESTDAVRTRRNTEINRIEVTSSVGSDVFQQARQLSDAQLSVNAAREDWSRMEQLHKRRVVTDSELRSAERRFSQANRVAALALAQWEAMTETLRRDVEFSDSALRRSQERLEAARATVQNGRAPRSSLLEAEERFDLARRNMEQARSRLDQLARANELLGDLRAADDGESAGGSDESGDSDGSRDAKRDDGSLGDLDAKRRRVKAGSETGRSHEDHGETSDSESFEGAEATDAGSLDREGEDSGDAAAATETDDLAGAL